MTQYYNKITSPIDANARIQRAVQLWTVQRCSRIKKGNSRPEQGAWKDRASDDLSMIYTTAAHLWSVTRKIHKFQTLEFGQADLGESELPNEW